jgi:hypothetical protein
LSENCFRVGIEAGCDFGELSQGRFEIFGDFGGQ